MGIAASRSTREPALAGLFQAYCVELAQLAYVMLGDREGAEEAVQEANLALFRRWPLPDGRSALAYLRSDVVNRCGSGPRGTHGARRGQPLPPVSVLDERCTGDAATEDVGGDGWFQIAEHVRELPRRQQEIVTCRYYLGLSEWETADFLEIGLGSVRRHAHRALDTLQPRVDGATMSAIERTVTEGLRAYGESLNVTTDDVDRLGEELEVRKHPSRTEPRGRFWQWAVAVCAVMGVVLGALALHNDLDTKSLPSGPEPVTLAQLEGIWQVAGSDWLWRFTPGGAVTLSPAPVLLTGADTPTAFTVRPTPGGFISENLSTGCSVTWAAIIAPEGRMSARGTGQTAACTGAADPPGGVWEFTRLSPVSVMGAATLPDRASQDPLTVTDLTSLTGTWLLRGTGTLLTVDAAGRYAIQDLGAAAAPATGTVTVRPGRLTFTPRNTLACTAVYGSVTSTDTALDTELATGSCSRLAATSDTWIRLN